jgi:tetratricopeptide (TPR) repeat protein
LRKKRFLSSLLFITATILWLSGCATKKKSREDLSLLGKLYHNTTALYNGYFNANEIMEATYLQLENSNEDNYTQLLKIFPYEGGNADAVKAELDRAIEKVSVVATIHEASHWRDDCYVLLCEAQFMQKDYETAEESLKFTVNEFDPLKAKNKGRGRTRASKPQRDDKSRKEVNRERKKKNKERTRGKRGSKKRKTEEEKAKEEAEKKEEEAKALAEALEEKRKEEAKAMGADDEGWFDHRPVYQDAVLLMAKTYIKRDKFSLADTWLRRLEENPGLHDVVREQVYAVRAQFFMEQNRWQQAEAPLEKAYAYAPNRKAEARYAYILGQIKEKKGDYSAASVYYDKVLDARPHYDMVFNAELRKAINAHRSKQINRREFADALEEMLTDEKNNDYQDQIYTALAEMSFQDGKNQEGIDYLKKALSSGDKTSIYKTEAFYRLAEFFYKGENYVQAKFYYDSTLTAMPEEDDRKPVVKERSESLTDIAQQIQILELQDSLIALSRLPKEELIERARALQEAEEEAAAQAADQSGAPTPVAGGGGFGVVGKSTFFAYDPLQRDKEMRDFRRRWGDRPLEDDWRRINKSLTSFDGEEEEEDTRVENTGDDALLLKFFSAVPFKEEDMAKVLGTKEEALFALGKLYRDKLKSCEKSTENLESLLSDFPDTKHELDATFYLYLCAVESGDATKAELYAQRIVNGYPESLYAKSINDPDFMKKEQAKKNKLEEYYKETYALFSEGEYDQVQRRLNEVSTIFVSQANLTAKFSLLGAMMAGKTDGKQAYISGLQDVIAKHRDTPEATRAREIMRFLQGDEDAFKAVNVDNAAVEKFKLEENKLHYVCVVIFDMGDKNLNEVKISVSSYNRRFHKEDKLNLSTLDLDIENSTPLVLIRKFKDQADAMDYYNDVMKRKSKFLPTSIQYEVYAISQRNYREVIKDRSVTNYRAFFNEYYLDDETSN